MDSNTFEQFPGAKKEVSAEAAERADKWESAMGDVPAFSGFGSVKSETLEQENAERSAANEAAEVMDNQDSEEFNASIANASALINFGINAASRKIGVEAVYQKINGFDPYSSAHPIRDLFMLLGVEGPYRADEIRDTSRAMKPEENAYRDTTNAPLSLERTRLAEIQAIQNQKKLNAEVMVADSKYNNLREEAMASGEGYFEHAAKESGKYDMVGALEYLSKQRENGEEAPQPTEKTKDEAPDDLGVKPEDVESAF